jgi:hypothetical protein
MIGHTRSRSPSGVVCFKSDRVDPVEIYSIPAVHLGVSRPPQAQYSQESGLANVSFRKRFCTVSGGPQLGRIVI